MDRLKLAENVVCLKKLVDDQIRALGIDADAWQAVMAAPGRFQSASLGGPAVRQALAEVCGRKWITDKAPIWLAETRAQERP